MTIGRLFVISAPSGAGKTTILKQVMAEIPRLVFSVSHTTRQPRVGEADGKDYFFIDQQTFREMIDNDLFLEYAQVHQNYYGTSRAAVGDLLQQGVDVILDIDVQGASILREKGLEGAFIFIAPPNIAELERRLRGRATESEEKIAVRMQNAKAELQAAVKYDYLLINDQLIDAIVLLKAIVLAERAKQHRLPSGEPIGDVL
jgi:guanylate kinase